MGRCRNEQSDYVSNRRPGFGLYQVGAINQNIIARTKCSYHNVPSKPDIRRIIVRDLSPESGGNVIGISNADFTLKRLVDKIDRTSTYMNAITSSCPDLIQIPPYFENDREAKVAELGPGDMFGEMALIEGTKERSASIRVLEDTTVTILRRDELETMLDGLNKNPLGAPLQSRKKLNF